MTTIVDTLFIDSTDVGNLGRGLIDFSGAVTVGARRGSNYSIPGLDGELYVAKPLAAFSMSFGLTITAKHPSTGALAATYQLRLAQMWANFSALVTAAKAESGGTVVLKRRLSTTGGSYTDQTCLAECSGGITPGIVTTRPEMRVVLEFRNLDGKWT